MTVAVAVRDVTKVYVPRRRDGTRRNKVALDGVSLEVGAGEAVAILGANGAGKSTLLRLIAGLARPTSGTVETSGTLAALLELGSHFHGDLTGRENAELAVMIAGRTAREARSRTPVIADFAGLSDVIDDPLRSYSSGMRARLAFAVATDTPANVVLVDEILAVGDLGFQQRCLDRMRELREEGVTFLVVTHDPDLAAAECDRAGWLRRGRVVAMGPAEGVARRYRDEMAAAAAAAANAAPLPAETTPSGNLLVSAENRFGTGDVKLSDVEITASEGVAAGATRPGAPFRLTARLTAPAWRGGVHIGASVESEGGAVLLDLSTPLVVDGTELDIVLDVPRLDLAPGRYAVSVGAYDHDWTALDYHWQAYPLVVDGRRHGHGLLAVPARWGVSRPAADAGRSR